MTVAGSHKYHVAKPADRKYNGVTYDSKAEMLHAQALDLYTRTGVIRGWARQCQVQLGPDFKWRVDFLVFNNDDTVDFDEVKGVETSEFKVVRRLWAKYGPAMLHVLKRQRNGTWTTEKVKGKQEASYEDDDQSGD